MRKDNFIDISEKESLKNFKDIERNSILESDYFYVTQVVYLFDEQ